MTKDIMNICVLQNWGLGDLVMTAPAISALRDAYPNAKITLIVGGATQALLLNDPALVQDTIVLPTNASKLAIIRFFCMLRHKKYDLGYIATRIRPKYAIAMRVLAGVPIVIGDGNEYAWLYNRMNRIDESIHRVDRMLDTLAMWTGVRNGEVTFHLPISPVERERASELLLKSGLSASPYVAIHPGSSNGQGMRDKRLPLELLFLLIPNIIRAGRKVAILLGPDDQDLLPKLSKIAGSVTILNGLSLDGTKFVLSNAAGFIGSDSALGHIAAAYGVPTITPTGPTNPLETRPWGIHSTVIKSSEELPCRPCWFTPLQGNCPYNQKCMRGISARDVLSVMDIWPSRETLVAERQR